MSSQGRALSPSPLSPPQPALFTPVPKCTPVSGMSDLLPISVTPILSRMVERLIVKDHIFPAITPAKLYDQFGFKPTDSTTAALVDITNTISIMLETNKYVRCLLIDFSKAFDSVDHLIVINKLNALNIVDNIIHWVVSFLTDRNKFVKVGERWSFTKTINRSIVQTLFSISIIDLQPIGSSNRITKYADDCSLMVPEKCDVDMLDEFQHVLNWTFANKLTINMCKTKELVFHRSNARNYLILQS